MRNQQAVNYEAMEAAPAPMIPPDFGEEVTDGPHLTLVPGLKERTPIDPLRLAVDLSRRPEPNKEEDREQISRLATEAALFLQDSLAAGGEEQTAQDVARFEEVYTWLDSAISPITNKIMGRYFTNGRTSRDDFRQVMRHHTISEIIPSYDPDIVSFMGYYKATAWRRVQEYVYGNVSQFFTPQKLDDLTEEDRQRIFSAFSYDAKEDDTVHGLPGDGEDEIIRYIMTKDVLTRTAGYVAIHLSEVERTVFYLTLQGMSYEETGLFMDMDAKAVDNAVQRARKKLASIGTAEIMED